MKIAIITRPDNKSPKILAQSFQQSLGEIGVEADIFFVADMLRRMVPLGKKLRYKTSLHFRIRQKIKHFVKDTKTLNTLKKYDAVVLSECVPNGFWRNYYALEELKSKLEKPLGFLEVFFLDAAPNHIEILENNNDHLQGVYDFHLALSRVSYQATTIGDNKFEVGLNLKGLGLKPFRKKKFFAVIDFEDDRTLHIREQQISILKKLKIEFVELKGRYTIEEIRKLYKDASVFFMQKYEAYGMALAECLAYGTKVFTPDSSWPSAFRLGEHIEYYGKGELADCFEVFGDSEDLETKLLAFRERAESRNTSTEVFESYLKNYPHFYYGHRDEVKRMITSLKSQHN
jgi:hypothetical protein